MCWVANFCPIPLRVDVAGIARWKGEIFFIPISQLLLSEKKCVYRASYRKKHFRLLQNLKSFLPYNYYPIHRRLRMSPSWLVKEMTHVLLDEFSLSDSNATFFIAGYIGRSTLRQNILPLNCKSFPISGEIQLELEINADIMQVFEMQREQGWDVISTWVLLRRHCIRRTSWFIIVYGRPTCKRTIEKYYSWHHPILAICLSTI